MSASEWISCPALTTSLVVTNECSLAKSGSSSGSIAASRAGPSLPAMAPLFRPAGCPVTDQKTSATKTPGPLMEAVLGVGAAGVAGRNLFGYVVGVVMQTHSGSG